MMASGSEMAMLKCPCGIVHKIFTFNVDNYDVRISAQIYSMWWYRSIEQVLEMRHFC